MVIQAEQIVADGRWFFDPGRLRIHCVPTANAVVRRRSSGYAFADARKQAGKVYRYIPVRNGVLFFTLIFYFASDLVFVINMVRAPWAQLSPSINRLVNPKSRKGKLQIGPITSSAHARAPLSARFPK